MTRRWSKFAILIAFCCVLAQVEVASAQPATRYAEWVEYWLAVREKGNYPEAERAGRTLMKLATGSLSGDRDYLADAQYRLGMACVDVGKYDEAERLLTPSLNYYVAQNEFSEDTFWAWHSLASLYNAVEEYDAAEENFLEAIRVAERISGPKSGRVIDLYNALGFAYRDAGRTDEAIETLDRVLTMRREVAAGQMVIEVANDAYNLGMVLLGAERPLQAEPYLQEALDAFRRLRGPDNVDVADAARQLGQALQDQSRFNAAEQQYRNAVRIYQQADASYRNLLGESLVQLGVCAHRRDNRDEATEAFRAALAAFEAGFGSTSMDFAWALDDLGTAQVEVGRYDEAAATYDRAKQIVESQNPVDQESLAWIVRDRGWIDHQMGKYQEAEEAYLRAMGLWEAMGEQDTVTIGQLYADLAEVSRLRGRGDEAVQRARRAVQILETADASPADLAAGINTLGSVLGDQGRLAEAEALQRRNLQLVSQSNGESGSDYGWACNNLATLFDSQGRFSDAVRYYRKALEVFKSASGEQHPDVAAVRHNLSLVYGREELYDEAEELGRQALDGFRAAWPETHPHIALAIGNVAFLRFRQNDFEEAEKLWQESLQTLRKNFGQEHILVGQILSALADLYCAQERYEEGIARAEEAVAIARIDRADLKPLLPDALFSLAELHFEQNELDLVEREVDEVILEAERLGISPGYRSEYYFLRARVAWQKDQRQEAVADLRRAIRLAEEQRGMSSGAELERAASFGAYNLLFEQMIRWQLESGDMTEAFFAFERSRARSLLDEMRMLGTNLSLDLSADERARLDERSRELKEEIVALERALRTAKPNQRASLQERLAAAQRATYELHRSRRSASPIYQRLLSQDVALPRISQLQRDLIGTDGLMLEYLFGEEGGYLLAIDGRGATLHSLEIPPEAAEVLGVESGPFTLDVCQSIMVGTDGKGVVPQLAAADDETALRPRLAWLYKTLLPEEYRQRVAEKQVGRIYLLPDGPLALLPFESLVDDSGFAPRYLLEVGPPIVYGPSVTILDELRRRAGGVAEAVDGPLVVSLGDPQYSSNALAMNTPGADEAASVRFQTAGGDLKPLPFSGIESKWVVEHFEKRQLGAVQLSGGDATEERLREAVGGCAYLHLACHGQADLTLGNFFGALALAPGTNDFDPANDGFLTLEEIYDLDLSHCELAVLSACQTNFGPRQKGEGVWSLSRGFISAGAQRVLASNWLVDDKAAASLISVFYDHVCQQRSAGEPVDYAAALQAAKRWVYEQNEWKNPFYWSTFVLLGPS